MRRSLLFTVLPLFLLPFSAKSQSCEISEVIAIPLLCDGNNFFVTIHLNASNTSPGFTLAGNGVIYGTYLYDDLPLVVGPLLGDGESLYEFIAWDVENPECQQFTTLEANDCGPVCGFSNVQLELISCVNNTHALVELDFDHQGTTNPAFDVFYENGSLVSSYLYSSLPVTIMSFAVNGAEPIVLTICDNDNPDCCETFELDAIDCNPNNCEIYNVSIDPECTGSNFLVHLDFDYTNVASDSFTIMGNTLNYGTFAYNELPLTLGPLNGGTNLVWEFNIKDSELPTCQKAAILGVYTCPPPCDVLSLTADALVCNDDNTYSVELNLNIEGEGDLGFSVFSNDAYYGTFEYDDSPITIPEFNGSGSIVDLVSVCDNDNPGCCETILYEALPCEAGCLIYNLHAVPQPCNDQNQIFVILDFDYHDVSDQGFSVSGNGTMYGNFQYVQVPVSIGPFDGTTGQILEFVVTDLVNQDCFDAVELGLVACDSICHMSNLVVETGDCTGNNTYVAHVDFDFENVSGIGFDLYANGEFYDFYDYEDLPITIEEFPSSGNDLDTITVCENDNPDCCTTLVFEAPNCQCHVYDATIQVVGCTSDSTFGVELEFFYENLPGDFVDVFFDGVFLGFYSVNDIPLYIPNIPEGDGTGLLSVCANDVANCCDEVPVELMNCNEGSCLIWDLFAEYGDCSSDSTFLLDIVFNHQLLPGDSVVITANEHLIGHYLVQPDFIRIENFPVLGNVTNLTVCALGDPECCDTYSFETPDCTPGGCEIWDLVADTGDCLTDSTYVLVLEYNSEGVPGDSFTITANGNPLGIFVDPDGHIVIEHFPEFETNHTVVTLCSVTFPDCCDVVEFETQHCPPDFPCHIFDLFVEVGECQSDSTYLLEVHFQYDNLPGDSVTVTANEMLIGHFPVNNGVFTIEEFPVFNTNFTNIHVCAFGSPDCCDVYEFETPFCGTECHIDINGVDIVECLTDSTYVLALYFDYYNLPVDSVTISAFDNVLGNFQVHEGQIIIEHFPLFDSNHTLIEVCAVGAPDCCDVLEFETPVCVEECHIFELDVNFEGCQTDSTYIVAVNFAYEHLPGDSVTVTANEQVIGQYPVQNGHIVIENFPIFGTNHTVITVCAVGAPDCCDVYELETPICDGSCHIFDLFAETGECTSDSTFLVDIVFNSINLPGDSVTIHANDQLLGNYFNHPDFIRIENFPHLDGETTIITVCAVGAPDCCDTFIIENPNCGEPCSIFEIGVDVFDCNSDSTFAIVVGFQWENVNGGGFDIYAGDDYLGFFTFDQIPAEIPHFPANGSGQYIVTVCRSDDLECCTSFEFEGPVCNDTLCNISNLTWSITECDSAGNFFFILDFDFANVGNEGFQVVGNGNEYGNFSYEDLPIEIGPFESNHTIFEFLVTDSQYPACFEVVVPGDVECFVATNEPGWEKIFQVYNNGSIPAILALENIHISIFNTSGKMILHHKELANGNIYELTTLPAGMYFGSIEFNGNFWPVKLVRNTY